MQDILTKPSFARLSTDRELLPWAHRLINDLYLQLGIIGDSINAINLVAVPGTFQPLDADLTAISALVGTGIACRTGVDAWSLRNLVDAGAGRIVITNPGGVAGNPTLDVSEASLTLGNMGGQVDWMTQIDFTSSNIADLTSRKHTDLQDLVAPFDDHTQYAYLDGRLGGQILFGGSGTGENLVFHSNQLDDGAVQVAGTTFGVNSLDYIWPGSNASGQLTNDGAGNLTWTPSAGSGTVTSVAGGYGITNTPEPITGAGTVDLDIFSLTTEPAIAAGDWLAFVDVSSGTDPDDQRKLTFSDLATAIGSGISHGSLTGLLVDDHTQYLLLAGRAGGQTAFGGAATTENLIAHSNTVKDGIMYLGDDSATTERVIIGGLDAELANTGTDAQLSILNTNGSVPLTKYRVASSDGVFLSAFTSRGTLASPTIVANSDGLFSISVNGAISSSAYGEGGSFGFTVDDTPSLTSLGTRFSLRTSAVGSISATERFFVDSTGRVQIPGSAFSINGLDYVWPSGSPANTVLKNDGADNLTWDTVSTSEISGGAALQRVDDTNVTMVLTGTPFFCLLATTTMTLGWAGQLSIARGGTGQATALAAFDALSPLTTRGDLVTRDTTNNIRLGIGTAAKYLRSDGTDPSWQTIAYSDISGTLAHSALSGLTSGDDHTQYFKLLGRAGGQVAYGSTTSTQGLQLRSNPSNDGTITLGAGFFGTGVTVDESTNFVWLTGSKVIVGPNLFDIGSVGYTWPGANATGVLKNNGSGTLSWAAVAFSELSGTLAHSSLSGLTSGDDHTQYLKLLGRAGGQIAYGGLNTGDHLELYANDETWSISEAGQIRVHHTINFPDSRSVSGTTGDLIDVGATYTLPTGGTNFFGLHYHPTFSFALTQTLTSCPAIEAVPVYQPTAAMTDTLCLYSGIDSGPTYTPLANACVTQRLAGYMSRPTSMASFTSTIDVVSGYLTYPNTFAAALNNFVTINHLRHFECLSPVDAGGGPAIGEQVGLYIPAWVRGTTKLSIHSTDSGNAMRHAGPGVFGADAAATNASVALEVQSTTKCFLTKGMTRAQRNTLAGVAVADGMLLFESDTPLVTHTSRHGGAWVEVPGWDICVSKAADQTTTSGTLQDDTDLQFTVATGEVWHFELLLAMSANNTTGDAKLQMLATAAIFTNSWRSGVVFDAAGALSTTLFTPAAFTSTTEMLTASGGLVVLNGDTNLFPMYFRGAFRASGAATVKVQFSVGTASGSRSATVESGSMLRAKKMV